MVYCKICDKITAKYKAKVILGRYDPPQRVGIDLRYKSNVEICPECGFIRLMGANHPFNRYLYDGHPPVTWEDAKKIDTEQIVNEMDMPGYHSSEVKIWIDRDKTVFESFSDELDDLSKGITFDQENYSRLINFMLLSPKDRKLLGGKMRCPVFRLAPDLDKVTAYISDGRRRYSILHYLGVKRIPVAVLSKDLEAAKLVNFRYYTTKD
jgi:hypothetical protein